jgi:hypothetical protein
MYVIRYSGKIRGFHHLENAKKEFSKLVGREIKEVEFETKGIGYKNNDGMIYELKIKSPKEEKEKAFSAFNNDPIMYNGPRGRYPDELDFIKCEDDNEDDNAEENEDDEDDDSDSGSN